MPQSERWQVDFVKKSLSFLFAFAVVLFRLRVHACNSFLSYFMLKQKFVLKYVFYLKNTHFFERNSNVFLRGNFFIVKRSNTVYRKESFPSKESDTKILQNVYFVISSYSSRNLSFFLYLNRSLHAKMVDQASISLNWSRAASHTRTVSCGPETRSLKSPKPTWGTGRRSPPPASSRSVHPCNVWPVVAFIVGRFRLKSRVSQLRMLVMKYRILWIRILR